MLGTRGPCSILLAHMKAGTHWVLVDAPAAGACSSGWAHTENRDLSGIGITGGSPDSRLLTLRHGTCQVLEDAPPLADSLQQLARGAVPHLLSRFVSPHADVRLRAIAVMNQVPTT